MPSRHSWTFFRSGGFDQVGITRAADIAAVPGLDLTLWAALACPVKGLEFDERTLALIDDDNDGRVRAGEIISAVRFVVEHLRDLATIVAGSDRVALTALSDATPASKAVLSCARHILVTQGRPDDTHICLADIDKAFEAFAKTPFNGDGIITADASADGDIRQAILDVIATHGSQVDRTGRPGIDGKRVEAFAKDLADHDAWWRAGEARAVEVFPLGERTLPALATIDAVAAKIDDYFARCRLAAYDWRAQAALNGQEKAYLEIAGSDLVITADEIRALPLARVEAGKALPLAGAVNPAWVGALDAMRRDAIEPVLGVGVAQLDEAGWAALGARFAATRAWLKDKAGIGVEQLGIARVRAHIAGRATVAIAELIAKDLSYETEFKSLVPVEKLLRLCRDFNRLLHNFVNFADFYSHDRPAIFQVGTLYLDSRACELCVRVEDIGKHVVLASMSKTYLAYCECTRPASNEKLTIAAAFTAGDADYLLVGRNGLFYDRRGRDWDATIVKVIEAPISIRQAFWAPYKRALRFVEETIAKRAAAADDAAHQRLSTGITETAEAAQTGKGPKDKPKIDIGTVAALGVAVGGITAAMGVMLNAFFGLGWLMPLGVLGLILAISGPAMVIALLKLRQRSLGPLLDASGWAVNSRVKINIPFGGSLTQVARLPAGATRSLRDPYAEKKRPWGLYLTVFVLFVVVAWLGIDRLVYGDWVWRRLFAPRSATTTTTTTTTAPPGTPPPQTTTTTAPPGTPPGQTTTTTAPPGTPPGQTTTSPAETPPAK